MLEVPEKTYASGTSKTATASGVRKGTKAHGAKTLGTRRDTSDDFARPRRSAAGDDDGYTRPHGQRFTGLRFRLKGGVPTSVAGRVAAGVVVLGGLISFTAVLWAARTSLLHDPHLAISSSSSIQTVGNRHLTRAQLLSVFGEDVERNILTVPLADRKAELDQLPWVEHATVMRLLPNKIRVAVVERVPVAFVRQGGHIGLVDKAGVLLDLSPSPEAASDPHYSFPVVTGVTADQPLAVRAARMKLYQSFLDALDAGNDRISGKLSEVDLSTPEDVKALIPSGSADILVHFGEDDFLARYLRFEQRLPEWKQQYPKLASADMRYEREVVLEMAPGSAVPVSDEEKRRTASAAALAAKGKPGIKPVKSAPNAAKAGTAMRPVAKAGATPGSRLAVRAAGARPSAAASKPYVGPTHVHPPTVVEPQ